MKKIVTFLIAILGFTLYLPSVYANTGYYYEKENDTFVMCEGSFPGCFDVVKGQSGVSFNLKDGVIEVDGHTYNYNSIKQEEYYNMQNGKTRMYYYIDKNNKYVICKTTKSCKSYTFDKLMDDGVTINHPHSISFQSTVGPGSPDEIYYFSQEQQDLYNKENAGESNNGNNNSGDVVFNNDCKRIKEPLKFVGHVVLIFKIIIPIIIIIFGAIDFFRAMVGSKDDEIKKSARMLIFRCISGGVIFLLPTLISFVFSLVSSWTNIKGDFNACQKCVLDVSKCK